MYINMFLIVCDRNFDQDVRAFLEVRGGSTQFITNIDHSIFMYRSMYPSIYMYICVSVCDRV